MDIRFDNQFCVVTGAGSGMGKTTARLLTELGANVYATVRRKPVDFAVTKQIPCDLGSKEGVDAMLAQLPDALEAIYICHGISNTQGNRNAMQVQLTNFYSSYNTSRVFSNQVGYLYLA